MKALGEHATRRKRFEKQMFGLFTLQFHYCFAVKAVGCLPRVPRSSNRWALWSSYPRRVEYEWNLDWREGLPLSSGGSMTRNLDGYSGRPGRRLVGDPSLRAIVRRLPKLQKWFNTASVPEPADRVSLSSGAGVSFEGRFSSIWINP